MKFIALCSECGAVPVIKSAPFFSKDVRYNRFVVQCIPCHKSISHGGMVGKREAYDDIVRIWNREELSMSSITTLVEIIEDLIAGRRVQIGDDWECSCPRLLSWSMPMCPDCGALQELTPDRRLAAALKALGVSDFGKEV